MYGFRKVETKVFDTKIGNIEHNLERIVTAIYESNAQLLVFPELCITGYTCQDMFLRRHVISDVEDALCAIAKSTSEVGTSYNNTNTVVVVGAPLMNKGKLFNCGVFIANGKILAVVPKTYIPNYNEFYEKRWFATAKDIKADTIDIRGEQIPFGTDIIVEAYDMKIACEICEDLWVSIPPSSYHTANGANVIVNLSASNEIIGKSKYRRNLVTTQSSKCSCAYVYCSAGCGESTSDVVWLGHQIIASCGHVKKEALFSRSTQQGAEAYIDIEEIANHQMKFNSFSCDKEYRTIKTNLTRLRQALIPTDIEPYPFVPKTKEKCAERCQEILLLQAEGLATRLAHLNYPKMVIGISGGLDSTLALLVCDSACKLLGLDPSNIIGVTMPGAGTSARTLDSANKLMDYLGITKRSISIEKAVAQHLEDIEHNGDLNIAYENAQARERTQILMDIANQEHGIVIGTGDLSELALGWCTYNGDHMSMYAVNNSVPKTLVKYMVQTFAKRTSDTMLAEVLSNIVNTKVSPELLPPDKDGNIQQETEKTIGKYDLHDFFLYHFIRNGFSTEKIQAMAQVAFSEVSTEEIVTTLHLFKTRFFANQFKRNCVPDGVKVGTVSLSPRGDWRCPSEYSPSFS